MSLDQILLIPGIETGKPKEVKTKKATKRRPDISTLHRWINRGVGGVRLEAVRIGNQVITSRQAITRFIEQRTAKAVE